MALVSAKFDSAMWCIQFWIYDLSFVEKNEAVTLRWVSQCWAVDSMLHRVRRFPLVFVRAESLLSFSDKYRNNTPPGPLIKRNRALVFSTTGFSFFYQKGFWNILSSPLFPFLLSSHRRRIYIESKAKSRRWFLR